MSAAVKSAKKKENLNDILKEIAKLDAKKNQQQQPKAPAATPSNAAAQQLIHQSAPTPKKKKKWPRVQTSPEPTVPVQYLFANECFPHGELMPYTRGSVIQQKVEQVKELPLFEVELIKARKAAECHRTVRKWLRSWIKPGMKMIDICSRTEDKIRELIENDGLEGGIAFPIGCSLNHVAAHYTPNPGDETILQQDDVLKIDIGIHEKGRVVDSAFTLAFNPKFDPLLEAVREGTNAGIKAAGIDVLLSDVGAAIQEVMESFEVELNGKIHRVKTIRNLCGHSIEPYHIHAGKTVPCVAGSNDNKTRMQEWDFFAIETFGSINGSGYIQEQGECSHYMKVFEAPPMPQALGQLKTKSSRELLKFINNKFGTLAWCRRYLDRVGELNMMALRSLVNAGLVSEHPPLCDVQGSYTAQFEHTIVLRPMCKEVLSRGDDY